MFFSPLTLYDFGQEDQYLSDVCTIRTVHEGLLRACVGYAGTSHEDTRAQSERRLLPYVCMHDWNACCGLGPFEIKHRAVAPIS